MGNDKNSIGYFSGWPMVITDASAGAGGTESAKDQPAAGVQDIIICMTAYHDGAGALNAHWGWYDVLNTKTYILENAAVAPYERIPLMAGTISTTNRNIAPTLFPPIAWYNCYPFFEVAGLGAGKKVYLYAVVIRNSGRD